METAKLGLHGRGGVDIRGGVVRRTFAVEAALDGLTLQCELSVNQSEVNVSLNQDLEGGSDRKERGRGKSNQR